MIRIVVHINEVCLCGYIFEWEGRRLRIEFSARDALESHRIGVPQRSDSACVQVSVIGGQWSKIGHHRQGYTEAHVKEEGKIGAAEPVLQSELLVARFDVGGTRVTLHRILANCVVPNLSPPPQSDSGHPRA